MGFFLMGVDSGVTTLIWLIRRRLNFLGVILILLGVLVLHVLLLLAAGDFSFEDDATLTLEEGLTTAIGFFFGVVS